MVRGFQWREEHCQAAFAQGSGSSSALPWGHRPLGLWVLHVLSTQRPWPVADYADAPLEKPLKLVLKVGGSEVTELSGSGHDSSYYEDRSDHERERHREKKKKKKKKSEKEKHPDDEERRKRKVGSWLGLLQGCRSCRPQASGLLWAPGAGPWLPCGRVSGGVSPGLRQRHASPA